MSRSVLLTDGDQRACLAIVRSLGRVGYKVYVCSRFRHSLAGASRYATADAMVADSLTAPACFVRDVEQLLARWSVDILVPVTEPSLLAILAARHRFRGLCIPFPDLDIFRRISDKSLVLDEAAKLSMAVPTLRLLRNREELSALQAGALCFPVIVKPSRTVADSGTSRLRVGVRPARNWSELESIVTALPPNAYPVLIQRWVVGPGVGIFLLVWQGRTLAVFSHRRIREKPPFGGVSVYCESVEADHRLVALSEALLGRFRWNGVAMVEYKRDAVTGVPYLMEVNGRFWGSLQLAIDSGVDFPALLMAAALGEDPAPASPYRIRVKSRWWWGEVDHLLSRLRRSATELGLPPGSPSRWQAVLEFLEFWHPGDRNEVLRVSDPLPFVRETIDWFRRR